MRDGGNAGWEPSALTDIATKLRAGAKDLGDGANGAPTGPDAGTSSAVVGAALAALATAGATASALLETIAGKVHAALGAYDITESSNTSKIKNAPDPGPGYWAEHAPR